MDRKNCSYERYFQLLVLVKTNSSINFLWISFVEGLHQHAATILAFLCTKFDYDNKIQPGSLSIQDLKAAKIPHFVDLKISPDDQIKLIMNGKFKAMMLKHTFTVEVYIPKKVDGNVLELMDSMCKQSEWILESKTRAENKNYFDSPLDLVGRHSCSQQTKKEELIHLRPKLTSMFTYQNPDTAENTQQQSRMTMITSTDFSHCSVAMSGQDILGTFSTNLFEMNSLNSSHQMVLPTIRKKVKPPYAIWWPSLTTDVGPIEKRSRCIDVRHVN